MENTILRKFEVCDFQYLDDIAESKDFAIVELWFLAEGQNSHKCPISAEVLRQYAKSVLGKFVICKYDKFAKDVTSHVDNDNSDIVGYVPPNGEVKFEEKNGKLFAVTQAVLSKIYARNVYEMFIQNNRRSVSVEFLTKEGEEDSHGNHPIIWFDVNGITILGMNVRPSVQGAEMTVLKFSADEAQNYFDSSSTFNKLKNFSERIKDREMAKSYKIDKSKEAMSDSPWGDVDKTALRNKIMDASNRSTLVEAVYMEVLSGWEDAPSENLKYPVMQFKGDTLVYNRGGLSSALGYAKAENDTKVVSKVEAIYDKLDLDKEQTMSETKFEIEGREAWGDVIAKVQDHEGNGAYVDSVEKDHIIFTKDGVRYRVDADVEVGKDDKTVKASIKWDSLKEDAEQKMSEEEVKEEFAEEEKVEEKECSEEEMSEESTENKEMSEESEKEDEEEAYDGSKEDDEEVDEEEEEDEKDFSYDALLDTQALNIMLKEETEDYRRLIMDSVEGRDLNIIMNDYLSAVKERDELRKYKEEKEREEVRFSVNEILCEAKADLTEDKYAELYKMGEDCTKETLGQFSNTVKAFAYDCSKTKTEKKEESEHITMRTFGSQFLETKKPDVNAIYQKALEK